MKQLQLIKVALTASIFNTHGPNIEAKLTTDILFSASLSATLHSKNSIKCYEIFYGPTKFDELFQTIILITYKIFYSRKAFRMLQKTITCWRRHLASCPSAIFP